MANKAKNTANKAKTVVKKKASQVKLTDVGSVIVKYLKGINKAYYVGALAIVATFLFFSPWMNITVISNLAKMLHLPFISGVFAIPQLILTMLFSVDNVVVNINSVLDLLNSSRFDSTSLAKLSEILTTISTFIGADIGSKATSANDIVASLQQLLPDPAVLEYYKGILTSISGAVKGASGAVLVLFGTVVGFNIYTAIITFWKKKITNGCVAAFIIEGVFVVLFMLICFVANTLVHSYVFFIDDIILPTGWAWLTLIACILGLYLCLKYKKPSTKKLSKKTAKKATKKK